MDAMRNFGFGGKTDINFTLFEVTTEEGETAVAAGDDIVGGELDCG